MIKTQLIAVSVVSKVLAGSSLTAVLLEFIQKRLAIPYLSPPTKQIKTQLIAVSVVSKVLAGSSLTAVLLECWQQHATLSGQQKGAIQDFSYGVLRFYGQLSEILAILLSKPPQDKKIYYLLLISLYQLLYSKLPAYTIVNQAVAASRTLTRSIKIQGLVNAVLRNFIRQKEMLLAKAAEKEVGLYSHPQWWIDKLRAQYPHHFHAVLNADNKRPPLESIQKSDEKAVFYPIRDGCENSRHKHNPNPMVTHPVMAIANRSSSP